MSTGQGVGGVVGAVIGAVLAAPTGGMSLAAGAALGFQTGMAVGGMLNPPKGPTVQGPRLSDLAIQTSTYGNFIPRVYGTIGIHGNILWLENNQLKETVRKQKQGGKGGGSKTTVKTYSYSGTMILALCQGPIAGIRRIWCMDKLIYNAGSEDLETIIASNQAAAGWKLYLGTDDQMPDPRYEADVGVGNASAFRGIAYLAFYDFQLADYSNTLQAAQFKVEIVSIQEDQYPVLIDVTDDLPASGVFYTGRAGNYSGGFYLSSSFFGLSYAYKLNRNGVTSVVSAPISINMGDWVAFNAMQSMDEHDLMFVHSDDGTGQLLFLENKNFTVVQTTFNLENTRYHERAGHSWVQFSYDYNNPDGSPSGSWIAKIDKASSVSWSYSTRFEAAAVEVDRYVPTPDGYLIKYTSSSIPDAGTLGITAYDELGAAAYSFAVSLNPTVATKGSDRSAVFVDDSMVAHFVFMLYRPINPLPPEYGKIYYVKVDLINQVILAQTEIFFPELVAIGHADPRSCFEEDGIVYFGGAFQNGKNFYCAFPHAVISDGAASLASITEYECGLSGLLSTADVDTSLLTDGVRGYRVSGGSIRSAIEPLQGAFPFDVIQSGYQIKCVPRGQASVVTIPWEDLGAADGDEQGEILRQSREMDSQLPARTTIKYLNAAREYAAGEQYAERINTEAINRVDRELPLVLTADEAAGVAEVLQNLAWLERSDLSITLPPTYLPLEGADVVTVTTPQASYQLRLTEINYTPDGRLECKAKPNRAALYTPNAAGGEGVAPVGTVPLAGQSIVLLLDIPVVDETLQNDVGFVGVMTGYTDSWPGGLLVRSNDDGQTWADLQGFTGKATIGTARGTLPSSDCTLIDQRTLTVDLISGELDSVTSDQMLAGVNYAAYGLDGRWEIVRFQNATLQGDGSYLISGFVRGEKGTEWATGLHAVDDYFVLLDDPDNAFIGLPVESIGLERLYRGVTSGASVDAATDVPFAYRGVNLECLSPAYAKGSRDGSSNFTGTFTRRSRLSSSWWATGVEAPLGEAAQAYEIDAMNGSTVVRTIAASTPTFAYSAADQATDFGSAQASITFRIYQLSAVVGRGLPLEVTL